MPLPLDDPNWQKLSTCYGGTAKVTRWLAKAYEEGVTDELLGDLINEIQHQGDPSNAMYAVAPHLLELARIAPDPMCFELLVHIGIIIAKSKHYDSPACPPFLTEEFRATSAEGGAMLAPMLATTSDFPSFKWGVAALAGFLGHSTFTQLLDNLDFFEGRFHYEQRDESIILDL